LGVDICTILCYYLGMDFLQPYIDGLGNCLSYNLRGAACRGSLEVADDLCQSCACLYSEDNVFNQEMPMSVNDKLGIGQPVDRVRISNGLVTLMDLATAGGGLCVL